jgi:hypothetical protein
VLKFVQWVSFVDFDLASRWSARNKACQLVLRQSQKVAYNCGHCSSRSLLLARNATTTVCNIFYDIDFLYTGMFAKGRTPNNLHAILMKCL